MKKSWGFSYGVVSDDFWVGTTSLFRRVDFNLLYVYLARFASLGTD